MRDAAITFKETGDQRHHDAIERMYFDAAMFGRFTEMYRADEPESATRGGMSVGTKNDPAEFDCYANALPDEPMFILLARDPSAPDLLEQWASIRNREVHEGRRPMSDQAMVREALECAANMREWRKLNDGAWRRK